MSGSYIEKETAAESKQTERTNTQNEVVPPTATAGKTIVKLRS